MNWLKRLLRQNGDVRQDITLPELSKKTGIKYITLWVAVNDGRLRARQSGTIWLSSVDAVNEAIREGRMKG